MCRIGSTHQVHIIVAVSHGGNVCALTNREASRSLTIRAAEVRAMALMKRIGRYAKGKKMRLSTLGEGAEAEARGGAKTGDCSIRDLGRREFIEPTSISRAPRGCLCDREV